MADLSGAGSDPRAVSRSTVKVSEKGERERGREKMSFELQKWERGMSSMPSSGSRRLAGVPGLSWGVLASLGTSVPQPLPKVCCHFLSRYRGNIPLERPGGDSSAASGSADLWGYIPVSRYASEAAPAAASLLVIPCVADDLISENSEFFYAAISRLSSAPPRRCLARSTLGWMEIKG